MKKITLIPIIVISFIVLIFGAAFVVSGNKNEITEEDDETISKPEIVPLDESASIGSSQSRNCDPSYPDVCIAPYPPDLNCSDVPYGKFRVVGDDPHGFDRDRDGIGCESN